MGGGWGRGAYIPPQTVPVVMYDQPSAIDTRRSMELEAQMLERRLNALKQQMEQMGADPK